MMRYVFVCVYLVPERRMGGSFSLHKTGVKKRNENKCIFSSNLLFLIVVYHLYVGKYIALGLFIFSCNIYVYTAGKVARKDFNCMHVYILPSFESLSNGLYLVIR